MEFFIIQKESTIQTEGVTGKGKGCERENKIKMRSNRTIWLEGGISFIHVE